MLPSATEHLLWLGWARFGSESCVCFRFGMTEPFMLLVRAVAASFFAGLDAYMERDRLFRGRNIAHVF
jgi:hypothetical protein